VQRPLTSGPGGGDGWLAGQVICWFGPRLRAHVSTHEGEGKDGGESWWRPNHMASRPRG
jgi:hypothetical protein